MYSQRAPGSSRKTSSFRTTRLYSSSRAETRWEYTWNALAKDGPHYFPGPYHAIDVGYMNADNTEYALYSSSPADDWPTTQKQFTWILRSFQEG